MADDPPAPFGLVMTNSRAVWTQAPKPMAMEVMNRVARRSMRERLYGKDEGLRERNGEALGAEGVRNTSRERAREEAFKGWEWMAL